MKSYTRYPLQMKDGEEAVLVSKNGVGDLFISGTSTDDADLVQLLEAALTAMKGVQADGE
ncbi:hypothetical protein RAN53_09625 [Halomonas sp. SSL-5]|uniref:hypothetical protein n=1 Tax=Halomonas sp. SSL-5 TaxID=3065855 RepID=UPI002739E3C2|nr:hypothetical protein [Halomonas sp. SSL-5]MDY7116609.1 hypothetical protein [Halomonas sp. SSL-5]